MTIIAATLSRWATSALAIGACATIASVAQAQAPEMTDEERALLRTEIRAFLMEEPELVADALRELERRRRQDAVDALDEMVAAGEALVYTGPEDASLTFVEFTDYNCPFCRRAQPEIQAFLESDEDVRHVVVLLPFIGSDFAERASLAAGLTSEPDAVRAFHLAMMGSEQLSDQSVLQMAAASGVDVEAMLGDLEHPSVETRYEQAIRVAQALGVEGTPAFVIGGQLVGGLRSADELAQIAALVRADAGE